ncbi:caspase-12-like [Peromyscus eremicus]|uniref:caspase-12-like n=1 Tax=Peromyscus eremicus TaxID=42410 RepID=UPI0027DE5394|nr:caspase-12-like [Peromyscus eremicus]
MQNVSELAFDFVAFYDQEACTAMAGKRTRERDPIYKIKGLAKNVLDGVFDDLVEKNVLNGDELLRIGEGARFLLNNAENLAENIFEKTEMVGKIFAGHIVNSRKQLRLKFHSDDEDDESQKMSTASSPADSENGIKDRKDDEQTLSEQISTFSLTEFRKEKEDEEMEDDVGVAPASHPILTAPQEIQSTEAHDTLQLCPRDQFYKMKTEKAKEIYPVMEKEGRTRLALIICNKKFDYLFDRDDAEVDILNMQELLQNLGYSVVLKENLTAQEMETELRQFAGRPEHQSSDSTFLVFMSHGILEGICGVKHRNREPDILHDDTIFTIFNNSNCRSLRNKPKILIMQACRGRHNGIVWISTRKGIATADTDEEHVLSYEWNRCITKAHVEKDFIAFKSSTPHNISWKVGKNGSLFISKLIDCFKKYCWCYHLEEIFRKVQHSFEVPGELTQMPTIERVSMTRYFYLFPGN